MDRWRNHAPCHLLAATAALSRLVPSYGPRWRVSRAREQDGSVCAAGTVNGHPCSGVRHLREQAVG